MTANQKVFVKVGAIRRCCIHCEVVSSVQASSILWFTAMIADLQSTCSSRTELGNTAFRFAIKTLTANSTGAGVHKYRNRKWTNSLTSSRCRFVTVNANIRIPCRLVVSGWTSLSSARRAPSCCGNQHSRVAGTFTERLYKRIGEYARERAL